MKTIYKSIALEAALLSVTLALQAEIQSEGETVTADVQANTLDRLKVTLVSPNVSGARDLVASGNATIDGNEIAVNLENLAFGTHRLIVSARFGTQIRTLYALDVSVPQAELPNETQEYEDEAIVVSTYGDGAGSEFPTDYAKQGDDPTATLTDTQAYAQAAAEAAGTIMSLDSDIVGGKAAIARAITIKGVPTPNTDSLQQMAVNIDRIPFTPIVYSGGEMYKKQIFGEASQWDLYAVTADAWNRYNSEYAALFTALYFKGYDSIDLDTSLADSYITSDGCYYHYASGQWLKEKGEIIEVITLDGSVIHHYWSDDADLYMDRYVIFLFYSTGRNYTVPSTNLCPRAIYYAGQLGSISCSVAGRIREIVKIGEDSMIDNINISNTQQFGQVLNIRGVKKHISGSVIYNTGVVALYYDEVEEVQSPLIGGSADSSASLNAINLPYAHTFTSRIISSGMGKKVNLLYLGADNIVTSSTLFAPIMKSIIRIDAASITCNSTDFPLILATWDNADGTVLIAENLTTLTGVLVGTGGNGGYCEIVKIYTPNITSGTLLGANGGFRELRDLWVGEYQGNLNLSLWTAASITSTDDIAEVNNNIRDHIAARIADGGSTQTITFGANLFNNLEQETIDAFEAKNWIVASA